MQLPQYPFGIIKRNTRSTSNLSCTNSHYPGLYPVYQSLLRPGWGDPGLEKDILVIFYRGRSPPAASTVGIVGKNASSRHCRRSPGTGEHRNCILVLSVKFAQHFNAWHITISNLLHDITDESGDKRWFILNSLFSLSLHSSLFY